MDTQVTDAERAEIDRFLELGQGLHCAIMTLTTCQMHCRVDPMRKPAICELPAAYVKVVSDNEMAFACVYCMIWNVDDPEEYEPAPHIEALLQYERVKSAMLSVPGDQELRVVVGMAGMLPEFMGVATALLSALPRCPIRENPEGCMRCFWCAKPEALIELEARLRGATTTGINSTGGSA